MCGLESRDYDAPLSGISGIPLEASAPQRKYQEQNQTPLYEEYQSLHKYNCWISCHILGLYSWVRESLLLKETSS